MPQSRTIGTQRETQAPSSLRLDLAPLDGKTTLTEGSIQFIGTATVLLRYAGFTILTDPNFLHRGESVRLGYGLRSRRLTSPAIPFEALPPIDFVLLSHLHEDHFDRRVESLLDHGTTIVTTPHGASALSAKGFSACIGLTTWQDVAFGRGGITARITSMPGRHGPRLLSRLLPPVMGSMVEFVYSDHVLLRTYITGDTVMMEHLVEIERRYRYLDQAILHLGGTRVLGVLLTMDGRQGVELVRLLKPRVAIPIHYNDYTVFKSPLSDFQWRLKQAGLDQRARYLRHGETYRFDVPVPAHLLSAYQPGAGVPRSA